MQNRFSFRHSIQLAIMCYEADQLGWSVSEKLKQALLKVKWLIYLLAATTAPIRKATGIMPLLG